MTSGSIFEMKVLITDYAWDNLDIETRVLAEAGAEIVAAKTGDVDELTELAADADAIMVNWKPCPAEVLEAAPNCKVVARYGVGLDNIDVARATELGMVVTNVPDFCIDEVAEHSLALIFALRRKIVAFAQQTRSAKISASECSATSSMQKSGTFVTTMPSWVARATSMLSSPTP